jgi:hypothetical protein
MSSRNGAADIVPCGGNGEVDVDDLTAVVHAYGDIYFCVWNNGAWQPSRSGFRPADICRSRGREPADTHESEPPAQAGGRASPGFGLR